MRPGVVSLVALWATGVENNLPALSHKLLCGSSVYRYWDYMGAAILWFDVYVLVTLKSREISTWLGGLKGTEAPPPNTDRRYNVNKVDRGVMMTTCHRVSSTWSADGWVGKEIQQHSQHSPPHTLPLHFDFTCLRPVRTWTQFAYMK